MSKKSEPKKAKRNRDKPKEEEEGANSSVGRENSRRRSEIVTSRRSRRSEGTSAHEDRTEEPDDYDRQAEGDTG